MRTRVLEEYGGMQQTRGRRAQGSGLVGGIASVATRCKPGLAAVSLCRRML